MRYLRPFKCEVYTPDGLAAAAEATSVVLPARDGQVGVLGGHAPMVALMGAGRLAIEAVGGGRREFFLEGGFAQVRENLLTIWADECISVEDIDAEAAWDEIQQARRMPRDSDEERRLRRRTIEAATVKFKLAHKPTTPEFSRITRQ